MVTLAKYLFGGLAVLAVLLLAAIDASFAQDAPEAIAQVAEEAAAPKLDSGDTAWMLTSTALVLLMTIPGLALFYGGMVRKKHVLAMAMQSFAIACLITVMWMIAGYTLAFGDGGAHGPLRAALDFPGQRRQGFQPVFFHQLQQPLFHQVQGGDLRPQVARGQLRGAHIAPQQCEQGFVGLARLDQLHDGNLESLLEDLPWHGRAHDPANIRRMGRGGGELGRFDDQRRQPRHVLRA